MNDKLFVLLQHVIPHHLLSRLMWKATRCCNKTWKTWLTNFIIDRFNINVAEAENTNLESYANFNEFFTRKLREGARPQAEASDAILSPADGVVSQAGAITHGRLIQAKGKDYGLTELLGGDLALASQFQGGEFTTIYLSPRDYHRLHMPLTGKLTQMIHVPGRLFSVNPTTVAAVPSLFARNERIVAIFETEAGPMALILVGAIFVSSIETVWHGEVTPPSSTHVRHWDYQDAEQPIVLKKGEEMGRFNMGSTIIVLFGKEAMQWGDHFTPESSTQVGKEIGKITSPKKEGEVVDSLVESLLAEK